MNRKELVEKVAGTLDMTKKDVDTVLTTTLGTIQNTIKKGDDVTLIGFGTFSKVKRAARAGVNPATGEKIKIKAKTVAKFKPGKAWLDALNPNRK